MELEKLMLAAQQAHQAKDYDLALCYRLQAYDGATNDSIRGCAARDVAASLDRIGLLEPAIEWADEAYDIHDGVVVRQITEYELLDTTDEVAVNKEYVPPVLRERAASAMYVGSLSLRKAITQELVDEPHHYEAERALTFLRQGLEDITRVEADQGGVYDQYRINMLGRNAMAEGLYGRRRLGVKYALQEVILAPLSESAMTSTYNLQMPFRNKLKAREFATVRGGSALLSTMLSFDLTRKAALQLTTRML